MLNLFTIDIYVRGILYHKPDLCKNLIITKMIYIYL